MKIFSKIHWLINPILIVVFMILLDKFFSIDEIAINTAISVTLAYVFSPKYKIVEKEHGEEEQVKWLFFKKVVNIKN